MPPVASRTFQGEAAVWQRGYLFDCAIGDEGYGVVAQNIAERVDDGRGLTVCREHARVCHAAKGDAEGLEAGYDLSRWAFPYGPLDELGGRMGVAGKSQILEKIVRSDILGEIAPSVCRHQHLGAESGLALDQYGADIAFGGRCGGKHAGRTSADDCQVRHFTIVCHRCDYIKNRRSVKRFAAMRYLV